MQSPIDTFTKLKQAPLFEFGQQFSTFRQTAFRFEALPAYDVDEERPFLSRFHNGESCPKEFNKDWLDLVQAAKNRGAGFHRVRYVPNYAPTAYLCFESLWGYKRSAALGEQILVLAEPTLDRFAAHVPILFDYWLFDETNGYLMSYDLTGRFLGVYRIPESITHLYQELAEKLLQASSPIDYSKFG